MIESTAPYDPQIQAQSSPKRVLKMVKNERMGGYVPSWVDASSEKDMVQSALNEAQESTDDFKSALNAHSPAQTKEQSDDGFGFDDLIDMINPLQHIPLVNTIYREFTGDTIKPIGKIVGGAVFGGPMGAISGVANLIVEQETGEDIASNAYSLIAGRQRSEPEKVIEIASVQNETSGAGSDLPGSLLSFADLGAKSGIEIKRVNAANGRTAGSMTAETVQRAIDQIQSLQAREPITEVVFDSPFKDEEEQR